METATAVMKAPPKAPITDRINLRALVFTVVVLFLVGWPVYTFLAEYLTGGIHDRGAYKEVDLKAMGFFEMNPANATLNDIPVKYRGLDGQKVMLKGEIFSPQQVSDLTEFQLVYSIQKCCYGGPPKVQERVFATVAKGKPIKYAGDGYHTVVGTLHVTMKKNPVNGEITEVYHLDADSVEPTK